MTLLRLITTNLLFYLRKNLLLALGVAISGAVLTGALVVGDSVDYSLGRIVENRLGNITHVLKAGDRYFTRELADSVNERLQVGVSTILLQEGSAVADGGQMRVNSVQVIGVEPSFDQMAGTNAYYSRLSGDSVIISSNLASRLNLSKGDELLLRVERASLIPLNAPFVSDAENVVTFRAVVMDIAGDGQMGSFNLKVSQTAPFNLFVSLQRLEDLMDFSGRVNVMLIDDSGNGRQAVYGGDEILSVISDAFSAADAGLKISRLEELQQVEVSSHRVFMDDVLIDPLEKISTQAEGIISYFVNHLSSGNRSTPYSFVSTLPGHWLGTGEIMINSWLAGDLQAGPGDSLTMSYFVVGPLRELTENSATFVIKAVVPMEGRFADRGLMPDLPGLSDAGNCRDWETGVPVSLESIRDKDEDYWDEYGGVPKAFISAEKGVELWKNRFGTYTAFRYPSGPDKDALSAGDVESALMKSLHPSMFGFTLEAVRDKGNEAAGGGVDFSQLFGGLSFFLLMAGVLLTVLLFLLNLEGRASQLRTLVVMGIPVRIIRRLILAESMLVALVGSLAGLVLAVLYNRLVFAALNGVWNDVIHTEMMHLDVRPATLATGFALTVAIAFLAIWFPLNRKLKRQFLAHKKPVRKNIRLSIQGSDLTMWIFISTGLAAVGLIGWQLAGSEGVNVSVFFAAGGLLLLSALTFIYWYLSRKVQRQTALELKQLSLKNARRNLVRSMSIVILFAIGAFLVISTGSNRKDLFANSEEAGSGTGGFLYFAESTVPVLRRLNDADVRYEYGLGEGYRIVQLRKAEGDDASCLNLNKIINPRILGVDPEQLEGRFSFETRTSYLDETNPWGSLEQELPGGLIPAIADETVIKWGLGLTVGDTLHYINSNGASMELLLIGGLAPSVFQGNVLIAESRFLEQFPENSGTNVFLVDGEMADTAMIQSELNRGLRDLGWEMELTAARLTGFYSVTNTYLSIFMVLGALGLLVGTFGLVVVLSRSILERKQEIALLKAVGYERGQIRRLLIREYMILLLAGIGTGFFTAIVATLPSILNQNTGTSFSSIMLWLVVLVLNGWIWIHLVTRSALNNDSIYAALRND